MSGEVIKEFLVGLGFQVDEAGLAKFNAGISGATVAITAMATATVAAAGAIFAGVKGIAAEYNELGKLATQFRSTAGAIDDFADSAKILGLSNEQSIGSLKNLDRAIVDTSMGMGRAQKVFEDLGIAVVDVSGKLKPTTTVMGELAEQFKTMERGKQLRVMERLGLDPAMIKVFNADMAALSVDMAKIDKATGLDFGKAIAEGKEFTSVWRTLSQEIEKWKMLFEKVFEVIAVEVMPRLRENMKTTTASLIEMRDLVMAAMPDIIAAIRPVIDIVLRVAESFISLAGRIASVLGDAIELLVKINAKTDGWAGYITAAIVAWKLLNTAFLTSPIGIITALGAAIALLVDDFLTFKEGGDSLIDWSSGFGVALQGIIAAITGVGVAMAALKVAALAQAAWTTTITTLTTAWEVAQKAITAAQLLWNAAMTANPIGLIIAGITALIAIAAVLITNWEPVEVWFKAFLGWLTGAWSKITTAVQASMKAAADAMTNAFAGVKKWLTGFFDWIDEKFSKISDFIANKLTKLTAIVDKVQSFFGDDDAAKTKPRAPALAPTPQAAAAITGGSRNVSQQTQITVQGASDPQATARAVAGQQTRVNADMARNMRGAAR